MKITGYGIRTRDTDANFRKCICVLIYNRTVEDCPDVSPRCHFIVSEHDALPLEVR